MAPLGHDIRFALRRLRQQPGFTTVAVLTLALGLGANIAVFTLVHALILRTLPVERPQELYRLGDTMDCCVNSGLATSYSLFSFRLLEHLKANAPGFTQLAAFQANVTPVGVRRAGDPVARSLPGAFVTGNYFAMFGVQAAAGRLLRDGDDRQGAPPAAVLSYRAWDQQFGRDPSVVGGAFVVNGTPMTIVGVAAPTFFGDTIRPDPAAIWIPLAQEPAMRGAGSILERPDQNWLYAIGRAAPGADAEGIAARLTVALQQWLSAQPFVGEEERPLIPRQHVAVVPAEGGVGQARAQYSRSLTILFAASGLVLLIALANLANLLLARVDRGQAAVRAALGAGAGLLLRQGLVEGVVLALAGGVAGVGVAWLGTRALIKLAFPLVSFVPVDASPSGPVWLFALGLSVAAGALFSAGPAWALSRTPPLEALSGAGRALQGRSFVPRGSLLVVQVALSLVLLSCAGLLGASLGNLERQRLGFTPENRVVLRIDPPAIAGETERLGILFARLEEALRRVPGVERVAFAMYTPMEGNNWSSAISLAGRKSDPNRPDGSSWNRVSAGYFEAVGTRILRGRGIDEHDTPASRRVAVVNEAFVRRFSSEGDPLGRRVGIGDAGHAGDYEIVGVVEDVKYTGATQPEVRPMLFLPSFQTVEYPAGGAGSDWPRGGGTARDRRRVSGRHRHPGAADERAGERQLPPAAPDGPAHVALWPPGARARVARVVRGDRVRGVAADARDWRPDGARGRPRQGRPVLYSRPRRPDRHRSRPRRGWCGPRRARDPRAAVRGGASQPGGARHRNPGAGGQRRRGRRAAGPAGGRREPGGGAAGRVSYARVTVSRLSTPAITVCSTVSAKGPGRPKYSIASPPS